MELKETIGWSSMAVHVLGFCSTTHPISIEQSQPLSHTSDTTLPLLSYFDVLQLIIETNH